MELIVLTPVIVVFVLLAVALGRLEVAHEQIVAAAQAGAEAASVAPLSADALPTAVRTVAPIVAEQEKSCTQLTIGADTSHFFPGGSVTITASCQVDYADLFLPGMPGHKTVSAAVNTPIDPYRSVQ